jgi:hypothetical protein
MVEFFKNTWNTITEIVGKIWDVGLVRAIVFLVLGLVAAAITSLIIKKLCKLMKLDKKLDKEDPTGNKVIFVNCHYFYDHRTAIDDDGVNKYVNTTGYDRDSLVPVFKGHKNLYHLFGHGEIWYSDNTVRYVTHHNKSGKPVDVSGNETNSSEVIAYENRDFTSIYAGHFRADANTYPEWFRRDTKVIGYAGLPRYGFTHLSTAESRVGQGLYIEVYEDRIVFTMKNVGDYPGFSTEDIIDSYTVWLYE